MPVGHVPVLFIDTSSLRGAGFGHPDLQKLLMRSKEGSLRAVVSHIAWEELRTQMRESECKTVAEIQGLFDRLQRRLSSSHILRRLTPPAIALWAEAEIDAASKEALDAYASEHRIDIARIGPDHGDRAWKRYFAAEPPFDPAKSRENRRKDIPDSWILEAAIDLVKAGGVVLALCHDDNLRAALTAAGASGFKEPADVLRELDRQNSADPAVEGPPASSQAPDPVSAVLSQAHEKFRDLDRRVVGFVAYLEAPTKQQLFALLEKAGIAIETGTNVTDRLVLAGVLKDIGNHYLLSDRSLSDSAASHVETEVIGLLMGS